MGTSKNFYEIKKCGCGTFFTIYSGDRKLTSFPWYGSLKYPMEIYNTFVRVDLSSGDNPSKDDIIILDVMKTAIKENPSFA